MTLYQNKVLQFGSGTKNNQSLFAIWKGIEKLSKVFTYLGQFHMKNDRKGWMN